MNGAESPQSAASCFGVKCCSSSNVPALDVVVPPVRLVTVKYFWRATSFAAIECATLNFGLPVGHRGDRGQCKPPSRFVRVSGRTLERNITLGETA